MLQKRRVLVVDDQRPTRQGLHALMAFMSDVEWVGEAVDGSQVAHLILEQRPDVVLMDVRMPKMDGIEATRRIKSQTPDVRVVILTLYGDYEAEAIAAGADVFLVKGGSAEDLRCAICGA